MKQLEGFQIKALLSSPEPDDPQDAEAGLIGGSGGKWC